MVFSFIGGGNKSARERCKKYTGIEIVILAVNCDMY